MGFHGGMRRHEFVVLLSCYGMVNVSGGMRGVQTRDIEGATSFFVTMRRA